MATAEQEVQGKLDGRDPNAPNYPPLPWVGATLYQEVELGQKVVKRPKGADPGKEPGESWWTPSAVDKVTALGETLINKYHGQTLWTMITALYALHIEGRPLAEIQKLLNAKVYAA